MNQNTAEILLQLDYSKISFAILVQMDGSRVDLLTDVHYKIGRLVVWGLAVGDHDLRWRAILDRAL